MLHFTVWKNVVALCGIRISYIRYNCVYMFHHHQHTQNTPYQRHIISYASHFAHVFLTWAFRPRTKFMKNILSHRNNFKTPAFNELRTHIFSFSLMKFQDGLVAVYIRLPACQPAWATIVCECGHYSKHTFIRVFDGLGGWIMKWHW